MLTPAMLPQESPSCEASHSVQPDHARADWTRGHEFERTTPWQDWAEAVRQTVIARAALPLWAMSREVATGAVGVLMYHRTVPLSPVIRRPTFNVTPDRLRSQLQGLLRRGYRPWALREVLNAIDAGRTIPSHVFVVTFDDGHVSNYTHAWPVLRELRVPATIFVATSYLDSDRPFAFDDWPLAGHAAAPPVSWRALTSAQCDEMLDSELVDLGTHTHTHEDFRDRPEALKRDLQNSLELLRTRFGITAATFAFPWGRRKRGHSGPVLATAARRAGVLCALTTESELVHPQIDRFDWGRFTVTQTDSSATLAAKIDGSYTLVRDFYRRLGRIAAGRTRRNYDET